MRGDELGGSEQHSQHPPRARARERQSTLLMVLLVAPAIAFVAATVILPTLIALVDSLKHDGVWTAKNYLSFATDAPYLRILVNTMSIACIVTIACVAICAPAAAFLATRNQRMAALLLGLIGASLWVSVLVRIYSWQVFLAKSGPLNYVLQAVGLTDAPLPMLFTRGAVVISMVQFLVPYGVMMMYAGMRRVDWELITAARSLGAGGWTVFAEVYWPQVRFSVITTALVIFMIATSFFVSPAILGGPRDTMLGMQMHSDLVNRYESGMAATTGIALTAILLVVAWTSLRLGGTSFRRLPMDLAK